MTLYKKVGRKYIPVSDTEAYEGLDNGSWMVHIENGSTQCRRLVEPANAALEFAILLKTNKISKYLMEASKARPKSQKLTKAQKKIVDQFYSLPNKDALLYWEYESYQGMAEGLIKSILN
jgi:polyphosphate kinase